MGLFLALELRVGHSVLGKRGDRVTLQTSSCIDFSVVTNSEFLMLKVFFLLGTNPQLPDQNHTHAFGKSYLKFKKLPGSTSEHV